MAESQVVGVWVRRLPPNEFRDIERHPSAGPAGGGGALYISVPQSVVPDLLSLLDQDPSQPFAGELSIDTGVIGAPKLEAPLVWQKKSGNRVRLFQNRQSSPNPRHLAWRASRGFPEAPDAITETDEAKAFTDAGIRVYVVRTDDDRYFAGYLVGEYPADWPVSLRDLFTGSGGVETFAGGLYLQPGDHGRPFRTIAGEPVTQPSPPAPPPVPDAAPFGGITYASPETARRVDALAMELGLAYAAERFPGATVERMAHNNPGFDIRVSAADGSPERYIEVKGTTLSTPRFFLSENERRFSEQHADRYTLVNFFAMDLAAGTAARAVRDGAITTADLGLTVVQWQGSLDAPA